MDEDYEKFQFSRGLDEIMKCLHQVSWPKPVHGSLGRGGRGKFFTPSFFAFQTNLFVQYWAPWHLVKDPSQHDVLETVLLIAMESLRLSGCLLHPALPQYCSRLLRQLGFSATPTWGDLQCKLTDSGVADLERASVKLKQYQDSKPLLTKISLNI